MLHLEKKRIGSTVRIKIRNRVSYILAVDGLSLEESSRLWNSLYDRIGNMVNDENGSRLDNNMLVHYLWWERQKIAVLFLTGDVVDRLEQIGKNQKDLAQVLTDFEQNEIHVPYCSMSATDGNFEKGEDKIASRVSMVTNEETGEVVVNTSEEICYAAFRK